MFEHDVSQFMTQTENRFSAILKEVGFYSLLGDIKIIKGQTSTRYCGYQSVLVGISKSSRGMFIQLITIIKSVEF